MLFKDWLIKNNIDPKKYMDLVYDALIFNDLDPELINFSSNPKYKLNYDGVDFGANGYNDYLIYTLKGDKLNAFNKRLNYRKRAYDVMIRSPKLSPSFLSYFITW
jgi:hypothetical protein